MRTGMGAVGSGGGGAWAGWPQHYPDARLPPSRAAVGTDGEEEKEEEEDGEDEGSYSWVEEEESEEGSSVDGEDDSGGQVSAAFGMASVEEAKGMGCYKEVEEDMEAEGEEEGEEGMVILEENEEEKILNWLQCDRCSAIPCVHRTPSILSIKNTPGPGTLAPK
jgi:hypothetical protein